MAHEKSPGNVSDNWPNQPSVSRSDLSKPTVNVPVKGGMKVVNTIPKSALKGPGGK